LTLSIILLATAACPAADENNDTDNGSSDTTDSTTDSTTVSTTVSTTDSTTVSTTDSTDTSESSGPDPDTGSSSDGGTDAESSSGESTGGTAECKPTGDACEDCLNEACCQEITECFAEKECGCTVACLNEPKATLEACTVECGQSEAFGTLLGCFQGAGCDKACG